MYINPHISCRRHSYCCQECQRKDWQRHKQECHSLSDQNGRVIVNLCTAADQGCLTNVKTLVQQGLDVNVIHNGLSALMIAATKGHMEVVRY